MTEPRTIIEDQAIAWVIRIREPGFAAWDGFTLWLEEDPIYAQVYDEVAAADFDFDAFPASAPRPLAPPAQRSVSRRFAIGGGALAASLAVVLGFTMFAPGTSTYTIETPAGAKRSVALADGSRIDLNGATKLVLDRDNERFAQLEQGEALFTVVHDDRHPFIVETGGATLTDAGTAFNVVRTSGVTEVAVSEGVVIYGKGAERLTLPAGRAMRAVDGQRAQARDTDSGAVGGWRAGQLSYQNADYATVAGDLARNLGVPVSAASDLAARPFSGVIRLKGDADHAMPGAAAVLGVSAKRTEAGWVLTAGDDAQR